ncbi:hypothetical protein KFL_003330170 [Klebsormidium nitens]|uniref:EGF-like domain-containing protein n=1 Tax=Klebsormidium nitens TaxID=105231 RepID=A0A1Y1I833_KLENI|nr:hypothetical protein KFL_003330170 [Klebsormidium nitens]|eukprot:GAQ87134.1 hypothetical protein KFL_003330170 [Klebsormidium nitens]
MTPPRETWFRVVWFLLMLGAGGNVVKVVAQGGTACFGDAAALQGALRTARRGDLITLCGRCNQRTFLRGRSPAGDEATEVIVNSTLSITLPVTLQGASADSPAKVTGSLTLLNGLSPLFFVADGVGPVTFRDLELQNSNPGASNYGGAVQVGVNAGVDFTRVVFRNNVAEYGGAVYTRGHVNFTSCAFVNNTAYGSGGAIYTDKAGGNVTLSVLSSSFLASAAGGSGGAIFFDDTRGILLISDSTFVGSAANSEGGALFLAGNASGVITGNSFLNGSAASGGGAIFIQGSALLAGNRFTGNSAPIGGAVFTYGAANTAFCGGDQFQSNAAQSKGYGNAVFVGLTGEGDGTAFCPSVPLEVDVAGDPVAGVAIGSCLNCDPTLLCSRDATGDLLPALQPVGVSCTCNPGFYGTGFVCYPLGSNVGVGSAATANLTSGVNLTALNLSSVVLSRVVNTSATVSPLSVTEGEVSSNPSRSSRGASSPILRPPVWVLGLFILCAISF